MTASQLCFVINPKSHRVAQHGSWLERAAVRRPDIHLLKLENFARLPEDIARLVQNGVRRFFVEGGDGTVLAVLSACEGCAEKFTHTPEFAVLAGGSTNLAYKIVGFGAKSAAQFETRLQAVLDGKEMKTTLQQALRVTGAGFEAPVIGFLVSTGTLARAMRYVQDEFHGDGHRGSLAVGLAIWRFLTAPHKYVGRDGTPVLQGSHLALRAGDVHYDGLHCLSIATSLPRLSLGLNPFWGEEVGGLAITYAQWPMPGFRSGLLEALTRKRPTRLLQKGMMSHRSDSITLTLEAPFMIDGEFFEMPTPGKVRISLTEPIGFLR